MNAAQFFDHWNVVWRDLLRGVSMLRDEQLAFRPAASYPRSVGDILRHIINLEEGWIHFVVERKLAAWPDARADGLATLDAVRVEMDRVHKHTLDYLKSVPVEDFSRIVQVPGDGTPKLAWILWHVFEQEIHHRGELFLCLSLMGMERPVIDRPS
ncbi:MAG TPA: DinB family protein [Anaerolineales bacterium]|nr:DinB family protein [Anaerolineales bacterium]